MDWLFILFLLISAVAGLLQKTVRETARRKPQPAPKPPVRPRPPLPLPPEKEVQAAEGLSLEGAAGTASEEGAASEEGVSLEGDLGEAEPAIVPAEILDERQELEREKLEFYAEAARLAAVEGEEGLPVSPGEEEFALSWKDEGGGEPASRTAAEGWIWTGDDLVRAVLAAEILGPPGGRWRPFFSAGPGKEVHGA